MDLKLSPVLAIIFTDWLSIFFQDYLRFIESMGAKIRGRQIGDVDAASLQSPPVSELRKLLSTLTSWVSECPAEAMEQRFGNKAFRTWHKRLEAEADALLREGVLREVPEASVELRGYLLDSFGNPTRIDYGTGHEMAFVFFLCALFKIGICKEEHSREGQLFE